MTIELNPRNDALGFAARTRKNLLHIESARKQGVDVHVVTQLGTALLGLIVFPREQHLDARVGSLDWDALRASGWPEWQVLLGECKTLGDFVYHLRNAVAHGHLMFSSDDRDLNRVTIQVEDYRLGASAPCWRACIRGRDLREFCLKFIDLVEQTLG